MAKEKLDIYFSVFNGHINNAHERALNEVEKTFTEVEFKGIKRAEKKGIMSIFDRKPTSIMLKYAKLVTKYVNE